MNNEDVHFFRTSKTILTNIGTKALNFLSGGVCSNEGSRPSTKVDNSEIVEIH